MRSASDICVPDGAVDFLRGRGWGIVRVQGHGFVNQPDENVWAFARRTRRVFITADYDFRRFRQFPLNGHPGCILINIARGLRGGETVTALAVRVLTTALPYIPTFAGMRKSRVSLDADNGVQVSGDGTERTLYRLV